MHAISFLKSAMINSKETCVSYDNPLPVDNSFPFGQLFEKTVAVETYQATAATGTVTIVDYTLLAGKTVTTNSVTKTEGANWTAATSNAATATSLASALDAIAGVSAAAVGNVVTITADAFGILGNAIGLSTNAAAGAATVSGAALSGGLDPYIPLITNTGAALVSVLALCTEDLAGATATLEIGSAADTDALVAATTATDIDNNEFWYSNAPAISLATSAIPSKVIAGNIGVTGKVANVSNGTLKFFIWVRPLGDAVVALA